MKDYLWIIVATISTFISLIFFFLTISKSTYLINTLDKKKINILPNIFILVSSFINVGVVIYLLLSVREQIELYNLV